MRKSTVLGCLLLLVLIISLARSQDPETEIPKDGAFPTSGNKTDVLLSSEYFFNLVRDFCGDPFGTSFDYDQQTSSRSLIRSRVQLNRVLLSKVNSWIDPQVYANSLFHYGLEDAIPRINEHIGDQVIIADFLAAAVKAISDISNEGVRYLEIGVSFGKTFYLVVSAIDNISAETSSPSIAYGFDAEDINPRLVEILSEGSPEPKVVSTWPISSSIVRRNRPGTMTVFERPGRTEVRYVAGDVVDRTSFSQIQNNSFNLVYSDAYHDGKFLLIEIESLFSLGLLDRESFAIIWDDLDAMLPEFYEICNRLHKIYPDSLCQEQSLLGWLGEQEFKHSVGLFTTAKLRPLQCLLQESWQM